MYLVLTAPNASDSTVAVIAPRIITEDPRQAINVARGACRDEYSAFISIVFIYKVKQDRVYSFNDALEGINGLVVFTAWRHPNDDDKWVETFHDDELAVFGAAAG